MNQILSVIIPVFNEERTIAKIIQAVEKVDLGGWQKEIIIVDDCSVDGTRKILKQWENQYTILYHDRNLGKGAAIRTALPEVKGDFVLIQDADLEYDPKDWPVLIKALGDQSTAAVYGSRNLNKSGRGYLTFYFGGRFLTLLMNLLFNSQLTDINTGYKLFRTEVLKSLDLQSDGFEFCEEVTAKLLKRGYRIKEAPISYRPRTFQEGKKISFADGLIGIWTILKNRF